MQGTLVQSQSGKIPCGSGQLSCVPQVLKPTGPRPCVPQQEKPPQQEACSLQLEKGLSAVTKTQHG